MLLNLSFACGSFSQVIWNGFFPPQFHPGLYLFSWWAVFWPSYSIMTPSSLCVFNLNINGVMLCLPATFFFLIYVFIYLFWLHWVFVAVYRLFLVWWAEAAPCCTWASHCRASRVATGSRFMHFRSCSTQAQQLWHMGFSSCSLWALEHGLSSCAHGL